MTSKSGRRRGPKPDPRRALELLASCRDGCTEALMLAYGFTIEQMVELIRAGHTERVVAAGRTVEVARVSITEAGRQALAGTTITRSCPGCTTITSGYNFRKGQVASAKPKVSLRGTARENDMCEFLHLLT